MALAVLLIAGGLQLLLLVGQRAFWRTTAAPVGRRSMPWLRVLMLRDERYCMRP